MGQDDLPALRAVEIRRRQLAQVLHGLRHRPAHRAEAVEGFGPRGRQAAEPGHGADGVVDHRGDLEPEAMHVRGEPRVGEAARIQPLRTAMILGLRHQGDQRLERPAKHRNRDVVHLQGHDSLRAARRLHRTER